MSKKPTALKSLPAVDLFKSASANAYFDLREHEAYYAAIKHVEPRRNFLVQLNTARATFLEVTSNEAEHSLVDELISRSLRDTDSRAPRGSEVYEDFFGSHDSHQDVDFGEYLQNFADESAQRRAQGWELLKLKLPLNLDSLKTSYRAAALMHHPDRGGSHENMAAINDTYAELHSIVLQEQFFREIDEKGDSFSECEESPATNCLDYRYEITCDLLYDHYDDWAIDRAFEYLQSLNLESWKRTPYTQDPWRLIELTPVAAGLAERLWIAGRCSDANWSLQVAHRGVLAAKSEPRAQDEDFCWIEGHKESFTIEGVVAFAEHVISGAKSARLVFNEPRQADNAFRLGVIDRNRYEKLTANFADVRASKNFRDAAQLALFKSYADSSGFIQGLPPDESSVGKVASKRLVPEPDYFSCSLAKLTKDQQAEYAVAFGVRPDLELVRKYLFVRLQSLRETLILHHDESPASERRRPVVYRNGGLIECPSLERMEAEARLLSELGNNPRSKSVATYSGELADAIQFLRTLTPEDCAERLHCLRVLATSAPEEIGEMVRDVSNLVESVCSVSLAGVSRAVPIELLRHLTTHLESIRVERQEHIRAMEQVRKKAALKKKKLKETALKEKKKLKEAAPKKKRLN
ncbi:MAG: hypothetical protein ACKV2Q_34585 [Planctomycetaceae bacterium]